MPKIADALERESRTVDLEQGDYERLLRRRERKERDRRIRAGALGLSVALVLGIVLARSLTSGPIPADPPTPPKPLPAPAAPGTLAYVLDDDVYVADPDGSNAVRIANGLGKAGCSPDGFRRFWAEGSMWSPDGRYLAYRGVRCPSDEAGTAVRKWGDVVISDAAGNVLATFPADGWDIGWSPDSSRVAAWDTLFETVGVYGVDGARQAQITMPSGWQPSGDHDPAWLQDGTLAIDAVELPLDGSAAGSLDPARASQWRDDYAVTIGQRALSPDGSHIAINHQGRSLVIEGPDGSASVTLLTLERGTSLSVIGFSPDGARILFSKDGEGARSLWSVGVDGSEARLLVDGTIQGEWFVPSVVSDIAAAPTGEPPAPAGSIAYVLDGDVYVADADGSNAVRIADGRPAGDCYDWSGEYWAEGPMWSPDGRYLAYRRYTACGNEDSPLPRDVVISDAAGNVVTSFPAQGWDIGWSPDSTRVAVWDEFGEAGFTIGIYGLDGARQKQIAMPGGWEPSGDYDPGWNPDGTAVSVRDVEIPLDGGEPRELRSDPETSTSPDGSQIASIDRKSLVIAAADGSDSRQVAGPWVLDPVWSPTGDQIAFIFSEPNENVYRSNELHVIDVASREVTPLVGMGEDVQIGGVQFSPEGDRIQFWRIEDRGRGEASLWSVRVDGSHARLVVAGTTQADWSWR